MTEKEIKHAKLLRGVTFLPGSFDKRFCRDMWTVAEHKPEQTLTQKQSDLLAIMVYRYRRQIFSNWEQMTPPPGYTRRGSLAPDARELQKLEAWKDAANCEVREGKE